MNEKYQKNNNGHNKRPGILIITPFYDPNIGGVETHLKDLTNYLKKENKYDVNILTYQPITTKEKGKYLEKSQNITIIRIPWVGLNLFHKLASVPFLQFVYVTPLLHICTFIFLLANNKKVDLIHAQGFNASFIARLSKTVFRKKFIASTHAIYELKPKSLTAKLVKWVLKTADKILTLSVPSREELIGIGIAKNKIETYRYWINQDVFKPLDKKQAKEKVGWNDKFIVLFVGRFIKIKGMDVLLDVARKTDKKLNFAFIGDGPLYKEIKSISENLANVEFIGKVKNHKLPDYYSAADILCIPSQYEEGLGRVILEALSCGTTIVGSNRGGIPEVVDSSIGLLVEPTAKKLKQAIENLYDDEVTLKSLSDNCRGYATKRFSEKNAVVISKSYQNCLSD